MSTIKSCKYTVNSSSYTLERTASARLFTCRATRGRACRPHPPPPRCRGRRGLASGRPSWSYLPSQWRPHLLLERLLLRDRPFVASSPLGLVPVQALPPHPRPPSSCSRSSASAASACSPVGGPSTGLPLPSPAQTTLHEVGQQTLTSPGRSL